METELNKKQSRKMTIFACLLSVISIVLLVLGFMAVSSNKVVMLQSISNLSKTLDNLVENNELLLNKIAISNDIGIKSNINFSSTNFNGNLKVDYLDNKVTKKALINADLDMTNQKILGLDVALANQNIYVSIDDITSKYYYQAFEYVSLFNGLSSNDYDKVMNILKEIINEQLDNKNIDSSKTTITYNGSSKKVNKLTYTITADTTRNFITKFLDTVKKDKDLLKNISNLTSTDFESSTNDIISALTNTGELNYNVYYYGFNKIVKYELETVNNNNLKIQYSLGDTNQINIISGTDSINIEFSNQKDKTIFNGYIMQESKKTEFDGDITENIFTLVVKNENGNYKLVINSSREEKENVFKYNYKIKISSILDNEEKEILTLDTRNEFYFDKKVELLLDDSVKFDEISDLELYEIYNNFQNHPLYQIYQLIQGLGISL